jgi:hypothetical protein
VNHAGEISVKKLLVVSRDTVLDAVSEAPLLKSCEKLAALEMPSLVGASSPLGAPDRTETTGSLWCR